MTHRQRILAAIRGEVPDRLPWVPRLEFWQRAGLRRGTLPSELRSLTLTEIAERLGVGCHWSGLDEADCTADPGMIDRGLGIFNRPRLTFKVTLQDVERRVIERGMKTTVEYHTPVGSIRTQAAFTEEMLDSGASMSIIVEHAIHRPLDFDVAGYIFSHLKVEPCMEGYMAYRQEIGEQGVAVAFLSGSACPMQHIMKDLMPLEDFFYTLHDCPEKVLRLAEQMEPYYQQIKAFGAESPAELILLGGNYDDSITHPAFFEKYILPALRDYAQVLHAKGKYLMTHTDGENKLLLPLYLRTGFDVADSVCPYPMTRCTLEEIRAAFADRITIWGGIPSTLLCPGSSTEDEFRRSVDQLIERYASESRFILGVSDMVTADALWERLLYVTEKVNRQHFAQA
jgi:hypothetical protein